MFNSSEGMTCPLNKLNPHKYKPPLYLTQIFSILFNKQVVAEHLVRKNAHGYSLDHALVSDRNRSRIQELKDAVEMNPMLKQQNLIKRDNCYLKTRKQPNYNNLPQHNRAEDKIPQNRSLIAYDDLERFDETVADNEV